MKGAMGQSTGKAMGEQRHCLANQGQPQATWSQKRCQQQGFKKVCCQPRRRARPAPLRDV